MKSKSTSACLRVVAILFVTLLFLVSAWATDREIVLHNFGNGNDVSSSSLIRDAAGNLYGVEPVGGPYRCGIYGCGAVFELSPMEGGGWTETILYTFGNGSDGTWPSGLVMDNAGNLYGLTQTGGSNGAGIAYELSPSQGGGWTETVLYNFPGRGHEFGSGDISLIRDAAGNLYGTTFYGVFELSPNGGGEWTETVLHTLNNSTDGQVAESGVIMDAAGNLYGTTNEGGAYCPGELGCGTVYELSPSVGGGWTETVLHSFNGNDGDGPWAKPLLDAAGNLYGTTSQGGAYCPPFGCGTVFKLSPSEGGWTETVLHSFNQDDQGWQPLAGLIQDSVGNLYGTTYAYGLDGSGLVFELSPREGGGWAETVLYSFGHVQSDLSEGVLMDRVGNLYGLGGRGLYGGGTAYELTPPTIRAGASVQH